MSIKYKIIIIFVSFIILSLGLTILYLSFKNYKPALKAEIINRIKSTTEHFDLNTIEYLKADKDGNIPPLSHIFQINSEIVYIKIFDQM